MDAELDKQITIAAVLIGYHKEAIMFVLDGWSIEQNLRNIHIDAETLCWTLHDRALLLYGSGAKNQLFEWKITTTEDFGKIVFGLIDQELLRAGPEDRIEDFERVFRFDEEFETLKFQNPFKKHQWNLLAIFIVTSIAAVAVSGFARSGVAGAFLALYCVWCTRIRCVGTWGSTRQLKDSKTLCIGRVCHLMSSLL